MAVPTVRSERTSAALIGESRSKFLRETRVKTCDHAAYICSLETGGQRMARREKEEENSRRTDKEKGRGREKETESGTSWRWKVEEKKG